MESYLQLRTAPAISPAEKPATRDRIGALDLFSSHCRVSAVEALPPYWYGEHVTIFRPFGLLGFNESDFIVYLFFVCLFTSIFMTITPLYYYYYY